MSIARRIGQPRVIQREVLGIIHHPGDQRHCEISTRPRDAEASTIWSTIYANRCRQLVDLRTMPLAARWGITESSRVKRSNVIQTHSRIMPRNG